jgi:hypothetical protein
MAMMKKQPVVDDSTLSRTGVLKFFAAVPLNEI